MSQITPFHVAVPVDDLAACEAFYVNLLGCTTGRRSDHWVDLNLMGHQFVLHQHPAAKRQSISNEVDGEAVPVPHYGVVLEMPVWRMLADKLREAKIEFVIEPYIRFEGQPGEQATMFFYDPAGNALEFKAFNDMTQLFATD